MAYENESDPAFEAFAITPHDTNYLPQVTRAIYVGVTGDVVIKCREGAAVTFVGVPAGMILPVKAEQVKATGTTADSLVGLV